MSAPELVFDGPDYVHGRDRKRLAKQHEAIRDLMLDGVPRTLAEIEAETGYPPASISAQLRHLRKERFGSFNVRKRHRGDASLGLYEYWIDPEPVRTRSRGTTHTALCASPLPPRDASAPVETGRGVFHGATDRRHRGDGAEPHSGPAGSNRYSKRGAGLEPFSPHIAGSKDPVRGTLYRGAAPVVGPKCGCGTINPCPSGKHCAAPGHRRCGCEVRS